MGTVAQGYLVYELTQSGTALGWVGSTGSISMLLLSLYGGVLSDRLEKRTILLWARLGMLLNALFLTILVAMGVVRIWHVALNSLLNGILFALLMPAQTSILSEIVDRETLLNAISLNSVGMGLMGILGASAAGAITEKIGVQGVYGIIAGLYLWAMYTLIYLPKSGVRSTGERSVWHELREGIRYIIRTPELLALLGVTLARVLLAMQYRTLLPKYATDVIQVGAAGLGMLAAAPGIGSLISSLTLASRTPRRKGKLLLISGILMGGSLLGFALARRPLWVGLFLVLLGATANACMVTNQSLVQLGCDDTYRGRVMSTYMMLWGLSPLGTIPAGALADHYGVIPVLAGQGILLVLIFATLGFLVPRLRALD